MKARIAIFWEQLRSSFWFVPALMVGGAIVLSFATLLIDQAIPYETLAGFWWIYTGGPDGARALLSTVAGSVITVAGVTFSITIAVLTLASSQFGPRLLRNFIRDPGNQMVLGTFIATFIYCVLVLRTIRQEIPSINNELMVPHVSVTIGVVLAIASLGVLIYFIHHISVAIQAENIIAAVGGELNATIDRLYPEQIGAAPEAPEQREQPVLPSEREAHPILARSTGYLQAIDDDGLLQAASEHDLLLRIVARPGSFVVRGSPIALAWPAEHADDEIQNAVGDAFILGPQRTRQQDVQFEVDQLVEIAVRALSPGINDPFTAIRCIDQLTAALCRLAERDLPAAYRYDDDRLCVIAEPVGFGEVVDAAFNQIRQYGRSDAAVTMRQLEALEVIAPRTHRSTDRAALLHQATMIERGSRDGLPEPNDRAEVAARFEKLVRAIEQVDRQHIMGSLAVLI